MSISRARLDSRNSFLSCDFSFGRVILWSLSNSVECCYNSCDACDDGMEGFQGYKVRIRFSIGFPSSGHPQRFRTLVILSDLVPCVVHD